MKQSIFILSTILLFGFSACSQKNTQKSLKAFNTFLGPEKAAALDEGLASFHGFLDDNFPDEPNQAEQIRAFLKYFSENNEIDSTWNVDRGEREKIKADWAESGLRKEVWLYGYENSDKTDYALSKIIKPEEPDTSKIQDIGYLDLDLIEEGVDVDSAAILKWADIEREEKERWNNSLHCNMNGKFWYGLIKFGNDDPFVYEYVELIYREVNISPGVIASGFTNGDLDFNNPFIQRIITTEFYFPTMIYQRWGQQN